EVEVGAVRSVRRIPGQPQLLAGLPPAVLADDDLRIEAGVEPRPGAYAAVRRVQRHPLAGGDAAGRRGGRVDLELRVGRALAQRRDLTVLGLAEEERLGTAQHQRIPISEVRPGAWADGRLLEDRQRRVAVIGERRRVQLDLAARRREPGLGVLSVPRGQGHAYALRVRPQLLQRDA